MLKTERPVLLQGPNGCGKSTFFKLISGLEEPNAGTLYLPRHLSFHGVFSVSQDLILPPRKMIRPKILSLQGEPDFAKFFDLVKGEFLLQKKGLSGGERAKVALLWAVAAPAKIILLDEPFAFIAQEERNPILLALLDAAKACGKWVMLASHEPISKDLAERFEVLDFSTLKGRV